MPVGDLPGWKQVLATDFTTVVPAGRFPGPYAAHWTGYNGFPGSGGNGRYSRKIISVHNGEMDLNLHTENGMPLVAAPIPLVSGSWGGQIYGRYSIRFRSDWLPQYGAAFLLWPDSNIWKQGEIDFPEGGLAGTIQAFNHRLGNPQSHTTAVNTGVTYLNWHTATIDWTPAGIRYYLDGKIVASDIRNIPRQKMHLVLQTGIGDTKPGAGVAGHVLIDWVTIYRRS